MGSLKVRLVRTDIKHAAALAELEQHCFSVPRTKEQLEEDIMDPKARILTALDGQGGVLGYAGMKLIVGECYVDDVAVLPAYRRRGIGEMLVQGLIRIACEEAADLITLEVRESNTAAINLYRKLGFETVGCRKSFYSRPQENAVLMTRYFRKEEVR